MGHGVIQRCASRTSESQYAAASPQPFRIPKAGLPDRPPPPTLPRPSPERRGDRRRTPTISSRNPSLALSFHLLLLLLHHLRYISVMSHVAAYSIDDKDLDDATLWALMDSAAAAASLPSKPRKLLPIKHSTLQSPTPVSYPSPPALTFSAKCNKRAHHSPRADSDSTVLRDGEVVQEPVDSGYRPPPPQKIARSCGYEASEASPLPLVRSVQRTPTTPMRSSPEAYLSPEISRSTMSSPGYYVQSEEKEAMRHCLSGKFPTVSLFKEYQNAAMAVLFDAFSFGYDFHLFCTERNVLVRSLCVII